MALAGKLLPLGGHWDHVLQRESTRRLIETHRKYMHVSVIYTFTSEYTFMPLLSLLCVPFLYLHPLTHHAFASPCFPSIYSPLFLLRSSLICGDGYQKGYPPEKGGVTGVRTSDPSMSSLLPTHWATRPTLGGMA